jgi:DNA modification methylase
MGRGPGWRKAAQHSGDYIQDGPRPKNNANFDLHLGSADLVMMRNKRTVWSIATKPFKEAHFATFPPALIEPCILAGCPKGGIVLDPFGGAGTTALVADQHGRNAILIEINPKYVAMAEARLARQRMGPEEKKRANIKSSGKLKPPKGLPLFASRVTKSKSVPAPGIAAA